MYQNFYYNRQVDLCHLWTDEIGNEYQVFPYEPYAYQIDPIGEYKTLTGLKVKKVKNWSQEAEKQGLVFEHDVPIATRVLIDRYFESDEPSKNHRILFFDIEVEKGLKYSTPQEALNRINSIAYFYNQKYVCLLLDETGKLENTVKSIKIGNQEVQVEVKIYKTEPQLLTGFLKDWTTIHPTIVSGWNSDVFDCPYLYNRMTNVLGQKTARKLSPIEIVEVRPLNKRDIVVKFAGITQFDYMQLYKKFTYNEESSYALDPISKKELGRGKYVYEGSLDQLFQNDIDGFIEYNVNDVELLVALDKKLDLIEIARGICHKGHVPYDDYQFSSRYLEGALLTFTKKNNQVAFSSNKSSDHTSADGAFVKPPKPGLHEWLFSADIQSLYPSLIMTCNISPETQMYYINGWEELNLVNSLLLNDDVQNLKNYEQFNFLPNDIVLELNPIVHELFSERNHETLRLSKSEFIDFIFSNNYTISAKGVVFRTDVKGIIPSILEQWFDERLEYKKLSKENKDNDLYQYYDRKQLITKILLNSLYGVLLLPSFRYYNKLNGESVTISGQTVIKFSDLIGTYYYRKRLNDFNLPSPVAAGDTDSAYFLAGLLLDLTKPEPEIIADIENISEQVIDFINKSVHWLTLNHFNSKNNRLKFVPEKVIRRAVWGQAKKRYGLLTADGELTFKGFDLVRSSFPKIFRKEQANILNDMLHNKGKDYLETTVRTFKKEYQQSSIFEILLPSSVKEISKYAKATKGTPIHVKSAQNYNKLLDLYKIESIPKIDDGDKILYGYMKQNPFGFETMALKGQDDDPKELIEFVERFIDRERIFQSTFISKLDTIWEDLGWGKVELSEQNQFF